MSIGAGLLAGLVALGLVSARIARAEGIIVEEEVFNAENRGLLCPERATEVTPEALAVVLFEWIPQSLVVMRYLGGGTDEARAVRFFAGPTPFQPPIEQINNERHRKVLKRAKEIREKLVGSLGAFLDAGKGRPQLGYRIVPTKPRPPGEFVDIFFAGGSNIRILCAPPSPQMLASLVKAKPQPNPFRIRGKVGDLAADPGTAKFKAASSAAVSFVRNDDIDKESFDVNGTVGFVLRDASKRATEQFIPYLSYKGNRTSVSDSATNKVRVANAGFLYNRFQLFDDDGPLYNFDLGLFPVMTFDFEQHARKFAVKAFFAPGAEIAGYILAQDNDVFRGVRAGSWLIAYPDVKVIAEASYVLDAGENAQFKDEDAYAGIGINPVLQLAFATGTVLDRVRLTGEYRYLRLVSGELDKAERFELGAEYRFDDDGNIKLRLEYVDGEQEDTLQDEQYWAVKLGVKF